MLLPIGDENPKERVPYVNYTLLAINIAVFFLNFPQPNQYVLVNYALNPSEPTPVSVIASMFLHANFFHILGNMMFLWIFGDNVEDKLGHVFYAIFYFACGLGATLAHILSQPDSTIPTLGASGAISGVVGAYVVMFPHAKVKLLVWFYFFIHVFMVPAFWWIGFWFAQQLIFGVLDISGKGGVAYWAHIGGFVAGAGFGALAKYLVAPGRFVEATGTVHATPQTREIVEGSFRDVEYAEESDATHAVLLTQPITLPDSIASIVARETGESAHDVLYRLRKTHGVIARNIDASTAERIVQLLRFHRVQATTVRDDDRTRPPVPWQPQTFVWDATGFIANGARRFSWREPFLVLAGQVAGRPVLDIFAGPRVRIRLTPTAELRFLDAAGRQFYATLQHLATALQRLRLGAAVNEGVGVLAGGGRWGWLAFPSEAEFEDYAFWVHALMRRR